MAIKLNSAKKIKVKSNARHINVKKSVHRKLCQYRFMTDAKRFDDVIQYIIGQSGIVIPDTLPEQPKPKRDLARNVVCVDKKTYGQLNTLKTMWQLPRMSDVVDRLFAESGMIIQDTDTKPICNDLTLS